VEKKNKKIEKIVNKKSVDEKNEVFEDESLIIDLKELEKSNQNLSHDKMRLFRRTGKIS